MCLIASQALLRLHTMETGRLRTMASSSWEGFYWRNASMFIIDMTIATELEAREAHPCPKLIQNNGALFRCTTGKTHLQILRSSTNGLLNKNEKKSWQ